MADDRARDARAVAVWRNRDTLQDLLGLSGLGHAESVPPQDRHHGETDIEVEPKN